MAKGKLGVLFQERLETPGASLISRTAAKDILVGVFGADLLPVEPLDAVLADEVAYAEFERVFLALDALLEVGQSVSASEIAARIGKIPDLPEESSAGLEETLEAVIAEQRRQTAMLADLLQRVGHLEELVKK